jgi:hypothetical protein
VCHTSATADRGGAIIQLGRFRDPRSALTQVSGDEGRSSRVSESIVVILQFNDLRLRRDRLPSSTLFLTMHRLKMLDR